MSSQVSDPVRFEAAVPQFTVADVARTAEYYRKVLGFEIAGYWNGQRASLEAEPLPVFGIVQRGRIQVFFNGPTSLRLGPAGRRGPMTSTSASGGWMRWRRSCATGAPRSWRGPRRGATGSGSSS